MPLPRTDHHSLPFTFKIRPDIGLRVCSPAHLPSRPGVMYSCLLCIGGQPQWPFLSALTGPAGVYPMAFPRVQEVTCGHT